jgi:hypothetical protein
MVNKGGRPLKFKSVEDLQKKIDRYFRSCWTQKLDMFGNPLFIKNKNGKKTNRRLLVQFKPYTITGLAVALDTDRATLIHYEAKQRFFNTIKSAKERCQQYAEESLFIGKNPAGAIFNLKNNYGDWKDKTEIDATIKGKPLPPSILHKQDGISKNNSNK